MIVVTSVSASVPALLVQQYAAFSVVVARRSSLGAYQLALFDLKSVVTPPLLPSTISILRGWWVVQVGPLVAGLGVFTNIVERHCNAPKI